MFSADFHFINETPPKRPKRRRLGHSPARRAPAKPPQSISNCECRILWKSIECIHERVVILEQMICELGRADYLNSAFGGPVCRSKDIKQQVLKISSSGASLKCPASVCGKEYSNRDSLRDHICSSNDYVHLFYRRLLSQNYCIPCEREFDSSKTLGEHQKRQHGEIYNWRIDNFRNGNGRVPCKLRW